MTSTGRATGRGRRRRRTAPLIVASVLASVTMLVAGAAPAGAARQPGDVGYEDGPYVGAASPTISKPQSKVWFNDGIWWASLLNVDDDYFIYRLDTATQQWINTGTALDSRAGARSDIVWDGTNLYVASHQFSTFSTGQPGDTELFKYSYNAAANSYSPVSGFPKQINSVSIESLSIDEDSLGTLWVAWVESDTVRYQSSADGGATWSAPVSLADPHATVTADDVATVVAFGGNSIGIMWTDQDAAHAGFWLSIHHDGAATGAWSAAEAAYTGALTADDHVNAKASSNGHLYAVGKTSMNTGTNPQVVLLDRAPNGVWTRHTVWLGHDNVTRPIVVLDEEHHQAQVFATGPEPPGTQGEGGGSLYRKTAPYSALNFADGDGQPVLRRPQLSLINDATSTKQTVSSATGLVVVASAGTTRTYWHLYDALGGGYRPFTSANRFADQQARDFLASTGASASVKDQVNLLFAAGRTAGDVIVGNVFLGSAYQRGNGSGTGARIARLYSAYFMRSPDTPGFDYWTFVYRAGRPFQAVSDSFAASSEFRRNYGALTNADFVSRVYQNVLHRAADSGGRAYWINRLGRGLSRGGMMSSFSESSEYRRTSDRAVKVVLLYRAMYRAAPTAAELQAELNALASGQTLTSRVAAILGSSRYQRRAAL